MKPLFTLLSLLLGTHAFCQTVTGVVQDANSREALPYVHIGILNKNLGVISRDDGTFTIPLDRAEKTDELIFSMLGYEVTKFKVADLKDGRLQVQLKPKVYQLKEVIVRSKKQKPLQLGRSKPTKTTYGHSNAEVYGWGGEWGLQIFNEGKKYSIEDVQFHLRFNTMDSVLFRLNIYSVKDNMPDQSLLTKELFVKSYKNKKWIIKNLAAEGLVLDQNVIVTFELVRLWFDPKDDNQLFFTYGEGYEKGKTYSRDSSLDIWKVDQRPPIAMFLSVFPL
jgi:hypothetical protein